MNFVSAIFGFLKNLFGYFLHRSQQNNRPEIVDNRERLEEQKKIDETNKAIKDKNIDKIRDDLSF